MKAFEKWWEEEETMDETKKSLGNPTTFEQGLVALSKLSWRATLEWMYSQLGYSEEHEELKDLIEKELEDK